MSHPAQYFIRYLMVAAEDISEAAINGTLRLYGLAPVEKEEYALLRAELESDQPEDLQLWNRAHVPTRTWLRKHKIHSLVFPDADVTEMNENILKDARLRQQIEVLLLGNVSHREISYRLQKKGFVVGEIAVAEFRHYFWNTGEMGLSDWVKYFEADGGKTGSGRTAATKTTLRAALDCGPEIARYFVGIEQNIDGKKVLLELQAENYYVFQQLRAMPLSAAKVEGLAIITRNLLRIDERISAGDMALQDTLRRFEQFKVRSDGTKVPSLADLAPTGSISQKSRGEILATREK